MMPCYYWFAKLIKKAGCALGTFSGALELVVERWMLHESFNIRDNTTHPLHNLLDRQQSVSSQRLLQLRCNKDRYRRSFLLTAVAIYNDSSV